MSSSGVVGLSASGQPQSSLPGHGASSDVTSFHSTQSDTVHHQYNNFQQQQLPSQSTKGYSAEHNAFNRQLHHPEEVHQPQTTTIQEESRLLRKLLNGYDRRVRPVIKASTKVNASIGITLTQIFDMVRPFLKSTTYIRKYFS